MPRSLLRPQVAGTALVLAGVCLAAWPSSGASPLAGSHPIWAGLFVVSMLFPVRWPLLWLSAACHLSPTRSPVVLPVLGGPWGCRAGAVTRTRTTIPLSPTQTPTQRPTLAGAGHDPKGEVLPGRARAAGHRPRPVCGQLRGQPGAGVFCLPAAARHHGAEGHEHGRAAGLPGARCASLACAECGSSMCNVLT